MSNSHEQMKRISANLHCSSKLYLRTRLRKFSILESRVVQGSTIEASLKLEELEELHVSFKLEELHVIGSF